MDRRKFTKITGLGLIGIQSYALLAQSSAIDAALSGTSRISLGLCNHSLRSMKLNAQQLIEYAIEHKLDSVLINTLPIFRSLEKDHLLKLKNLADKNEISIYIGAGSISENSTSFKGIYGSARESLLEGIRVASIIGSPVVGCRIGNIKDRYQPGGIQAHMKVVIEVMSSLRKEALDAGIMFAMENHAGDLRVEEILEIIEETGTDISGILYDPANAVWAMENPMESLQRLKKHILCTSVRDVMIWESKEGAIFQGMAIGDGMMNYKKYAEIMAKSCPGVPLHVETISNSARPIPFKTDEFLKGWPEVSQSKINEFARLASKGRALELLTPEEGISKRDFDIALQQSELQKSFDYLRNHCNAGLKVDVN